MLSQPEPTQGMSSSIVDVDLQLLVLGSESQPAPARYRAVGSDTIEDSDGWMAKMVMDEDLFATIILLIGVSTIACIIVGHRRRRASR